MSDEFDKQMEKLAISIAKRATLDDTPFTESLEALKALNPYYANRAKHLGKPGGDIGDDDPGGPSLADLAAKMNGDESGHGSGRTVRSRSRGTN